MKKRKTFKTQPLFRREKDLISLLKSKNGLSKIEQFAKITNNLESKLDNIAKDLLDWQTKVCAILPKEYKTNKKFLSDLSTLVAKYEISSSEQTSNTEEVC